jgi:hypothetical protein
MKRKIFSILFIFIVGNIYGQQLGAPTPLQVILNDLPAIPLAGRDLKFQFGGDTWIARVGGENFMAGSFASEDTGEGTVLTLRQTHIWSGAAGRAAGRALGGIAGGVASSAAARWIEMSGAVFVLLYKAGPSAGLSVISTSESTENTASGKPASTTTANSTESGQESTKSGHIIATFGFGAEFLSFERWSGWLVHASDGSWFRYGGDTAKSGGLIGVNILFIGRSGFTISTSIDIKFKIGEGINIDPVLGLGYVSYNKFYIGGIFNFIAKPYLYYYIKDTNSAPRTDMFLAPTLVVGYDFGSFTLGGQLSFMYGSVSSIPGFRFLLGAGVNIR